MGDLDERIHRDGGLNLKSCASVLCCGHYVSAWPAACASTRHQILRALLDLNAPHEFVFLYQNPKLVGTYSNDARVTEVALSGETFMVGPNCGAARHRPAWHRRTLQPEIFPAAARELSDRLGMPWPGLVRHALGVAAHRSSQPPILGAALMRDKPTPFIAVSEITREHVLEFLRSPRRASLRSTRGSTMGSGTRATAEARASLRRRYDLPQRFFLYSGAIYPPKNSRAWCRRMPRWGRPPASAW